MIEKVKGRNILQRYVQNLMYAVYMQTLLSATGHFYDEHFVLHY